MLPELTVLVEVAADEMSVDVASFYVRENEDLVLRATFGLNQQSVGNLRLKLNEGLTGAAYTSGRPLPISEPASHPRYRFFPQSGEEEFHSYLGIPLPNGLGVLVFQTRQAHYYTQSEVRAAGLWAERMAREWVGLRSGRAA